MVAVDAGDLPSPVAIASVVSWPGRRRGPRRLVGPASVPGMVQLHQAIPIVERQHALIEELRARAPRFVRGTDLATRTGTTVRTVERDLARLTEAGVPVEVRRGPGGGYRINTRASLPPLTLDTGRGIRTHRVARRRRSVRLRDGTNSTGQVVGGARPVEDV